MRRFAIIAILLCESLSIASPSQARPGDVFACKSNQNKYRECFAGPGIPRFVRQTSSATCIPNRTYGFNLQTGYVWVSNGCSGIFARSRTAALAPPPAFYPTFHPDYRPYQQPQPYVPQPRPYYPPAAYDPVTQQALQAQRQRDQEALEAQRQRNQAMQDALNRRIADQEAQARYNRIQAEMNRPRPGIPNIKPVEIPQRNLDPFGTPSDDAQPPTASQIPGMVCEGKGDDATCDAR